MEQQPKQCNLQTYRSMQYLKTHSSLEHNFGKAHIWHLFVDRFTLRIIFQVVAQKEREKEEEEEEKTVPSVCFT